MTLNRITNVLERLAESQDLEPINQPRNQEKGENGALDRFLKFAPPKFHGGSDPEVAKNWFERMLEIFVTLDYAEERAKWEREQTLWSWANFEREFIVKFLQPMTKEKREDDFIKLKQGLLSVVEYEEQFTKLSKFALELVIMERKRIRRFIQELKVKIQESLAAAQIATFSDALDKAQRVENTKSQSKPFHARKRGNPIDTPRKSEKSTQPLNVGRGAGGVRMPEKSGESEWARSAKREISNRSGRDSSRNLWILWQV
nr:uncharacterized protein LOC113718241 [Coffea arabica]